MSKQSIDIPDGAVIKNIRRGRGNRSHIMYASLYSDSGELLISATLDYICGRLRGEPYPDHEAPPGVVEQLRMQLAACGVAAMQNTSEARTERIGPQSPYWSAAYGDVCAAVDREIALRERLDAAS